MQATATNQVPGNVTPLEAEVLREYERLATNIDRLASLAQELASTQTPLLEQLRPLERQLGLTFTLFKASVFAQLRAHQAAEEERELAEQRQQADLSDDLSY